ncbi:MAG: hypothetical protein RIR95_1115 [Pseudomonadota bacterium]
MSNPYLTEKLAEVRAELNRLHQEEALLIKAVLAEPEPKQHLRLNTSTSKGTDLDLGSAFLSNSPQTKASDGTHPHFQPRPRPGWPMTRTNPTSDLAQCPTAPPKLALVHSAH